MSHLRVRRFVHGSVGFSRRIVPFLIIPGMLAALVTFSAFRHEPAPSLPNGPADGSASVNPLVLPTDWPMIKVPADNPITQEKFVLGRQLFYEKALSGDDSTSCSSCHDSYLSFAARGPHAGAFGDQVKPLRNVPRLINLGYDTVLMWDGHFTTLEQQVRGALNTVGELNADTLESIRELAANPAYVAMFTNAFGDDTINVDRVAQAIATFERCLISGNSPYDQYMNGDQTAMSASAVRGMNLFFDTMKTNCSDCHNNRGSANPNSAGQTFTDGNYYRTGTFELTNSANGGGGYGLDTTTRDTLHLLDAGRAAVTRDTADIGKFRTPTLRNVALTPPYGAEGNVPSLEQVIATYNAGGTFGQSTASRVSNQDPRIRPLKLDSGQLLDLAAFINSLSDLTFISNASFEDPGSASVQIADRTVAGNLSVYPNPAGNFVNAESPDLNGMAEAVLVSTSGATVWSTAASAQGRVRLDFTGVPNGVYRLELRTSGAVQSANIVLQR